MTNIAAVCIPLSSTHKRIEIAHTQCTSRFLRKYKLSAVYNAFRLVFTAITGVAATIKTGNQATAGKTKERPDTRST